MLDEDWEEVDSKSDGDDEESENLDLAEDGEDTKVDKAGRVLDDLRWVAVTMLPMWAVHGAGKEAAEVLVELACEARPKMLNNEKAEVQKVYDARWAQSVKGLFSVCGITRISVKAREQGLWRLVVPVMSTLLSAALKMATEDRAVRAKLIWRIE
jgi:hypothetical protein